MMTPVLHRIPTERHLLAEGSDPDAAQDERAEAQRIADQFLDDVSWFAYLDLRTHGNTISVAHAALEFELACERHAERLTGEDANDVPY